MRVIVAGALLRTLTSQLRKSRTVESVKSLEFDSRKPLNHLQHDMYSLTDDGQRAPILVSIASSENCLRNPLRRKSTSKEAVMSEEVRQGCRRGSLNRVEEGVSKPL